MKQQKSENQWEILRQAASCRFQAAITKAFSTQATLFEPERLRNEKAATAVCNLPSSSAPEDDTVLPALEAWLLLPQVERSRRRKRCP